MSGSRPQAPKPDPKGSQDGDGKGRGGGGGGGRRADAKAVRAERAAAEAEATRRDQALVRHHLLTLAAARGERAPNWPKYYEHLTRVIERFTSIEAFMALALSDAYKVLAAVLGVEAPAAPTTPRPLEKANPGSQTASPATAPKSDGAAGDGEGDTGATGDAKGEGDEQEEEQEEPQDGDEVEDTPPFDVPPLWIPPLPAADHESPPQDVIDMALGSVDRTGYFVRVAIPRLVSAIIYRKDLPPDLKPTASRFFQVSAVVVSAYCGEDLREHWSVLARVFNSELKYYRKEESISSKVTGMFGWKSMPEGSDQWKYCNPKKLNDVFPLYGETIEFFGNYGGFDRLIQRLKDEGDNRVELENVNHLLRVLTLLRDFWPSSFAATLVPSLWEALRPQLAWQLEHMSMEDERMYDQVIKRLDPILCTDMPDDSVIRLFLELQLDAARANLRSPALERQMQGLRFLKSVVKRTKKKSKREKVSQWIGGAGPGGWLGGGGPSAAQLQAQRREEEQRKRTEAHVPASFLAQWLTEHAVLDTLFHADAHPELVRQGIDIPSFMAAQDLLEKSHLTLLWNASVGKHEAVRHVIYSSIVDLTNQLSADEVAHLYALIQQLPLSHVDEECLTFMRSFCGTAINKHTGSTRTPYGLEAYWKLLAGDSDDTLPAQTWRLAYAQFCELIALPAVGTHVSDYFQRCYRGLSAGGPGFIFMCDLSVHLLKLAQQRAKRRGKSVLDSADALLDNFFTGLAAWHGGLDQATVDAMEREGEHSHRVRHTHMDSVRIVFAFLEYVLTTSSLHVSEAQVDKLWDTFIVDPFLADERAMCVSWLASVNTSDKGDVHASMSASTMDHVFSTRMLSMSVDDMSLPMFALFERYLLRLGQARGTVVPTAVLGDDNDEDDGAALLEEEAPQQDDGTPKTTATDEAQLEAEDNGGGADRTGASQSGDDGANAADVTTGPTFLLTGSVGGEVAGVKLLWSLALDSVTVDLANAAMSLLNRLHLMVGDPAEEERKRVSSPGAGERGAHRRTYCETAIHHLTQAQQGGDEDVATRRTQRMLTLLRRFVLLYKRVKRRQLHWQAQSHRSRSSAAKGDDTLLSLYVRVTGGRNQPSSVMSAKGSETIASFRQRVAEVMNKPAVLVRMAVWDDEEGMRGKELSDVTRTLESYRVADRTRIVVDVMDPSNPAQLGQVTVDTLVMGLLELAMQGVGLHGLASALVASPDASASSRDRNPGAAGAADGGGRGKRKDRRGKRSKKKHGRRRHEQDAEDGVDSPASDALALRQSVTAIASSPKRILADSALFHVVYNLLSSSNAGVGEQAWELLELLPPAPELWDALSIVEGTATPPDWSRVIPAPGAAVSVHQAAYVLQIVDEAVKGPLGEAPHVAKMRQTWRRTFVTLKGLQHVLGLLLGLDTDMDHVAPCFVYAFKVVNTLSLTLSADDASFPLLDSLPAGTTPERVVTRIMAILHSVSAHAEPGATSQQAPIECKRVAKHGMRFLVHLAQQGASKGEDVAAWFRNQGRGDSSAVSMSSWLRNLCLLHGSVVVRHNVTQGMASLVGVSEDMQRYAGSLILSLMGQVQQGDGATNGAQYWALLESIIKRYPALLTTTVLTTSSADVHDAATESVPGATLFGQLVRQLRTHASAEHAAVDAPDQVLIGQMNLARALLRNPKAGPTLKQMAHDGIPGDGHAAKPLVHHLFHACLFDLPSSVTGVGDASDPVQPSGQPEAPACKTRASRRAAMRLLSELCRGSVVNMRTTQCMLYELLEPVRHMPWTKSWGGSHALQSRAQNGYVGLANLGATCYMNSLMQQLFAVPEFRSGIVAAEDTFDGPPQKSMLHQLQLLFVGLAQSRQRYFNTRAFCDTLVDFEGNPINTSQQQDANEFFNTLVDRTDGLLAGTSQSGLLRQVFGGTFINELICKEGCEHRKQREEPFYTVSIEVKNKATVAKSLELFVQGEMLDGDNAYLCDPCKEKRPTLKRCVFGALPNVLVVHLKRFEFRYDTMDYAKLNDRFEFPMDLNVFAYTKEGLAQSDLSLSQMHVVGAGDHVQQQRPPSYYQYHLRGIVIHEGGANAGHYWSIIREHRAPGQKPSPDDKWFKFNDRAVTEFDVSELEDVAFGGTVKRWVRTREGRKQVDRPKSGNAYILVYERTQWLNPQQLQQQSSADSAVSEDDVASVEEVPLDKGKGKGDVDEDADDAEDGEDEEAEPGAAKPAAASAVSSNVAPPSICVSPPTPAVPREVLQAIAMENAAFLRHRSIFCDEFMSWVWNLLTLDMHLVTRDPDKDWNPMSVLQLGLYYFIEVYGRHERRPMASSWIAHLRYLLATTPGAAEWLVRKLLKNTDWSTQHLCTLYHAELRRAFGRIVGSVFTPLGLTERDVALPSEALRNVLKAALAGHRAAAAASNTRHIGSGRSGNRGGSGLPTATRPLADSAVAEVEAFLAVEQQAPQQRAPEVPAWRRLQLEVEQDYDGSDEGVLAPDRASHALAAFFYVWERVAETHEARPRRAQYYFALLHQWVLSSREHRAFFVQQNGVGLLMDYFLTRGIWSQDLTVLGARSQLRAVKAVRSTLGYLVETIAAVFRGANRVFAQPADYEVKDSEDKRRGRKKTVMTPADTNEFSLPPNTLPGPAVDVPSALVNLVYAPEFLVTAIRELSDSRHLKHLLVWGLWEDAHRSEQVLAIVQQSLQTCSVAKMSQFFAVYSIMVVIEDSLQPKRTKAVMERILEEMWYASHHHTAYKEVLHVYGHLIMQLARSHPCAMKQVKDKTDDIVAVLRTGGYKWKAEKL